MLTKLISFLLVYILTVLNFLVFLSPLTFLFISKYFLNITEGSQHIQTIFLLIISAINVITIILLCFDFLFSYSVRKLTKNTVRYDKNDNYKILDKIFNTIKDKYNTKNVELYISNDDAVNAYAVGSLRRKVIILTTGILNFYASKIEDKNKLLLSIKGIMAHEMSHLINNDYFTGLLLLVNERAVKFVSHFVFIFFNVFIKLCSLIPFVGRYMVSFIVNIYNIFDFIISFFYKYILLKVYNFIKLQLSRNIEYRADKQASMVVGGINMAETLNLLGGKGYISIFSTHPLTKHRVKNVENVEISEKTIKPVFLSREMFVITLIILLCLCYFPYKMANIEALIRDYNEIVIFFQNKYMLINSWINRFLEK